MDEKTKAYFDHLKVLSADHIIAAMPFYDNYSLKFGVDNFDINSIVPDLTTENAKLFNLEFKQKIIQYLIDQDYVRSVEGYPSDQYIYKLTDWGRTVKKKGGHFAFRVYQEKMDKVPLQTLNWAKVAAIASILSILTWVIDKVHGCNNDTSNITRHYPTKCVS